MLPQVCVCVPEEGHDTCYPRYVCVYQRRNMTHATPGMCVCPEEGHDTCYPRHVCVSRGGT